MKIRHIGIAVDSIEDRLPVWESFGLKLVHTEKVDSEGVTTAHLKVGDYEIELLEQRHPLETHRRHVVSGRDA